MNKRIWIFLDEQNLKEFDEEWKGHYQSRGEAIRRGIVLVRKEMREE